MKKDSIHEVALKKLFNIDEELNFFDIGACEGLSSARYSSMFPKASVYAFEPVPKNFKLVVENQKKNSLKKFYPFQLGLSSKKGKATFYVSSGRPENKNKPADNSSDFGNKSSSLYKPGKTKEVHPWLKFKKTITIETETLDSFCINESLATIDFIHMDVQGAELMVLQGAQNMLPKIKSIWLEVERIALYEKQALKKDIEVFLDKNGFICIINKVNYIAGDQFWVRETYFNSLHKDVKKQLITIKKKTHLKSNLSTLFGALKYGVKKIIK
ncbi:MULTISPECIES: FkbM family methyltransferase [unclassified Polaribacter]|uniref:FkbM family methyltransferase n=1 Tax=unclassified Polaribacter TaxID=196858 RepID=UPI0011BEA4E0|nr:MULTISPECIES: FkbM family methyltransferase [unclassified Polaribacter]TXD50465.1 FkbM family methyltransferase [Polaribacter sp. IC063]TXD56887.1 FkbM family methyltransferase [Polaribacter sp. IC066]